jgi:hypothetical protein
VNLGNLTAILLFSAAICVSGCGRTEIGNYRGTFPVYFAGTVVDANTREPVPEFTATVSLYERPYIVRQVQTSDKEYALNVDLPTINGVSYRQGAAVIDVLGPHNEFLTLDIRAPGYAPAHIRIPKDKISIDEVNTLNLVLRPAQPNDNSR